MVPQLIINTLAIAGGLWYLTQALSKHKNRALTVLWLAVFTFGLVMNLRGYTMEGWQEGFSHEKG